MRKIGFMKSLYYYLINPYWETVFSEMGFQVVICEGKREILPSQVNSYENELCLPVKYLLSQVENLKKAKVDYIFAPLVSSIKKGVFSCPKVIVTPDLIELYHPDAPELIVPVFNCFMGEDRFEEYKKEALTVARRFNTDYEIIEKICKGAKENQRAFEKFMYRSGLFYDDALNLYKTSKDYEKSEEGLKILILGHRYTVHNKVLNNNLLEDLRRLGASPLAKEHLLLYRLKNNMKKEIGVDLDIYFSEGAEILRAAWLGAGDTSVKGIIYLSMFNCGFDAVIEDVIAKRVIKNSSKPYLNLVLDEHSTKANVMTRLEVFLDIVAAGKEASGVL